MPLNFPNSPANNDIYTTPDGALYRYNAVVGAWVVKSNTAVGGGTAVTTTIVTANTQTAVKDNRYVLSNSTFTTVTLPASPAIGDTLYITVANGLANNIVIRNGEKIMGLTDNLTIDIVNTSIGLTYTDTTLGWRFI